MKKVLLSMLCVVATLCAYANEAFWTATFNKGSDNNQSAYTTSAAMDAVFASGGDKFTAITATSNASPGLYGLKIGTNSGVGSISLSIAPDHQVVPTKVVLKVSANSAPTTRVFKFNDLEQEKLSSSHTKDSYKEYTITGFSAPMTSIKLEKATSSGSGYLFIESITVYYEEASASKVAKPTFSVANGAKLYAEDVVTINCETEEAILTGTVKNLTDNTTDTFEEYAPHTINFTKDGQYEISVTASADDLEDSNATITVTYQKEKPAAWTLVTSADELNEYDLYVITSYKGSPVTNYYVMNTTPNKTDNPEFYGNTEISISDNMIEIMPDEAMQLMLVPTEDGKYYIKNGEQYLQSTKEKGISLTAKEPSTAWGITISDNFAAINWDSSFGSLYYNPTNPRFTTYKNAQNKVQLYRLEMPRPVQTKVDDATFSVEEGAELAYGEKVVVDCATEGALLDIIVSDNADYEEMYENVSAPYEIGFPASGEYTILVETKKEGLESGEGEITINYVQALPKVTFSVESNGSLHGTTPLVITCGEIEDVTLTYTINGEGETTVAAPAEILFTEDGEYTIAVTAEKEGFDSSEATITVNYSLFKAEVLNSATGEEFIFTQTGENPWKYDSKYSYLKGSGYYNSETNVHDDVAYTTVDLTDYVGAQVTLNFEEAFNNYKVNNVMIGVDDFSGYAYVVVREAGVEEWTNLCEATAPSSFSWTFYANEPVGLTKYAGKKIDLGFRYVSTATCAGTWEVKNIKVSAVRAVAPADPMATVDDVEVADLDEGVPYNLNDGHMVVVLTAEEGHHIWHKFTVKAASVAPGSTETVPAKVAAHDDAVAVEEGDEQEVDAEGHVNSKSHVVTYTVMQNGELSFYVKHPDTELTSLKRTLVFTGSTSGIAELQADGSYEYYDLQGRKVSAPKTGIYIVRQGRRAVKTIVP